MTRNPYRPRTPRPCRGCAIEPTRSAQGLCWQCRPTPRVYEETGSVYVVGLGRLPADRALELANRIADVLAQLHT